jgi:hypothetical protein
MSESNLIQLAVFLWIPSSKPKLFMCLRLFFIWQLFFAVRTALCPPPQVHQSCLFQPVQEIALFSILSFLLPAQSTENLEWNDSINVFKIHCCRIEKFGPMLQPWYSTTCLMLTDLKKFLYSEFVFAISHLHTFGIWLSGIIDLNCSI